MGHMLRVIRRLLPFAVIVCVLLPAQAAFAFKDVPNGYWDYTAIQYVATQHNWMADYTDGTFHPRTEERRKWLARALVLLYAPRQGIDPNIHFSDLPDSDPFFPFANVAVHNGWLGVRTGDAFLPDGSMHTSTFDRALVLAMGLHAAADGLASIHEDVGGYTYTVDPSFPYLELAHVLGLHYNHPSGSESMDIEPTDWITRDEVAYSLWKAAIRPYSWRLRKFWQSNITMSYGAGSRRSAYAWRCEPRPGRRKADRCRCLSVRSIRRARNLR